MVKKINLSLAIFSSSVADWIQYKGRTGWGLFLTTALISGSIYLIRKFKTNPVKDREISAKIIIDDP
jgi:hypothetical protein